MNDERLEKSMKNLERVAGLIHNLRLEGCGGLFYPEKECVAITVRAEDIPPMEIILGWLYPPRFTFQDDGPEFELVEYLERLGEYEAIVKPYDDIIADLVEIWLDQCSYLDPDSDDPRLKEVIDKYKRYKAWDEKRTKGSEGCCVVVDAGAGGCVLGDKCHDIVQGAATVLPERPDLELTDEERWKRFEALEKRVEALEQSRKVGF